VTATGDGWARRSGGSGDGSARIAGAQTRPVGAAVALVRLLSVARESGRDAVTSARRGRAGGHGVRGSCWARRCPDSALNHAVGVAHGGHAAAALCRVGPAWRATTDKRGPLVSDFRIKIYPEGN
jgi:hypothetical protein